MTSGLFVHVFKPPPRRLAGFRQLRRKPADLLSTSITVASRAWLNDAVRTQLQPPPVMEVLRREVELPTLVHFPTPEVVTICISIYNHVDEISAMCRKTEITSGAR